LLLSAGSDSHPPVIWIDLSRVGRSQRRGDDVQIAVFLV
jgi:hypothetical protein